MIEHSDCVSLDGRKVLSYQFQMPVISVCPAKEGCSGAASHSYLLLLFSHLIVIFSISISTTRD